MESENPKMKKFNTEFEKWWLSQNVVPTNPPILEAAFKEVAELAWNAAIQSTKII